MNFKELLLSMTAIVALFFAVPAFAADLDGDGIPDSEEQQGQ